MGHWARAATRLYSKILVSSTPSLHNEASNAALLLFSRGISATPGSLAISKSGTFSGGKFSTLELDEKEDIDEDEDADPDTVVLHRTEVVPYRLLSNALNANPHRSPKAVVAEWQKQSKMELTKDILLKIFRKLSGRQRHDQLYRLMRWVLDEKPIPLTPKIHEYAMKAAQKNNKLQVVKKIFDETPAEHKTPAIYTRMMSAYCNKNEPKKAEAVLETFTPTTAQAHNQLILMYIRMEQDEQAIDAYNRMRKAGLRPTDLTFVTLAKNSRRLGIEIDRAEAEEILDETLSTIDTKADGLHAAVNVLLAYAYMGDFNGAKKAWSVIEGQDYIPTYAFAAGVEAFGQLGKMEHVYQFTERAESRNTDLMLFYPSLVKAYVTNGRMDRAVGLVNSLKNKRDEGKVAQRNLPFGCYDELIAGHLALKERDLAMEKTKEGLEVACGRTRPSYVTLKKMLGVYKKAKDVEAAEALFWRYRGWRDARVFNQLLEVYAAAQKAAPKDFEARMKKCKVAQDGETPKLLEKCRSFLTVAAA